MEPQFPGGRGPSHPMSESLRIHIVTDGPGPRQWQLEWLRRIEAEAGLEIAEVTCAVASHRPRPWLFVLYRVFDEILHSDRGALFRVAPPVSRPSTAPASAPDLMLDLTSPATTDRAGTPARFGTWSIVWSEVSSDDEPAGLREMLAGSATTTSMLVATASGTSAAIDRTVTATHRYSLLKGRAVAVAAMGSIVMKQLRRLRDRRMAPPLVTANGTRSPAPEPRRLGNAQLVRPLARFAAALVQRLIERIFWDEFHWSIALARRIPGASPESQLREADFRRMEPPRDRFYADPFLVEHRDQPILFLEEYSYRTGRGSIAFSRLDHEGRPDAPRPALERPYHLSWPFVFEHDGVLFMIPETYGNRTVELYRCRSYPEEWTLESVLVDGMSVADPTLFHHGGRWWLFFCFAPPGMSPDTELHVHHAPSLLGPWTPHELNPVVSNVRSARPAGRIWREGDQIVRPAQDCSVRYGHGITFNRITRLTPDDYAEESIGHVVPDRLPWCRGAIGMHTWNASSRLCATDVCVSRFRGSRWLMPRSSSRPGAGP